MTDYIELKRLAEAANAVTGDVRVEMTLASKAGPNQGEVNAVTAFMGVAAPATVLALIAENERLNAECKQLILLECYGGTAQAAINLLAERDQLKAENEAAQALIGSVVIAAGARLGQDLVEVIEALRDDIEQNQYDANAWRNGEERVWIEVFNSEGDDPFISAITGKITVEQLALIQAEILEYREDYFEKGAGLYVFRCVHCQAHYDNVGMTEPAHWETDFESYSPFPWEEEGAAMGKGEQP